MPSTLLAQVRALVQSKIDERNVAKKERDVRQAELDSILEKCEAEKRDLNNQEAARFTELRSQLEPIDATLRTLTEEIDGLESREADIKSAEEAREAAQRAADAWATPVDSPERVNSPARVKSEPRTYSPEAEIRGVSFIKDVFHRTFGGDPDANDRIERHQREARLNELAGYEKRAVGTSAFAGLTVPQYLTDMAAPYARAMSPTVQICNRHPLPADGMTVNISRITTALTVAAQAGQGSSVSETNMDDTLLTVDVRTYAGQQTVSRQAIDRGTGIDEIVVQDLVSAYWTKLDDAILNADGTSGTHIGIRSTTGISTGVWTDTSPTVPELYSQMAQLIGTIQTAAFQGVTHFIMHPRRWWWIVANSGTSFPFLNIPGVNTVQAGQAGGPAYGDSGRSILGVPVVLDGNCSTAISSTQDSILGVTAPELHLWEDSGAPLFIRAEQPSAASLQVLYVCYSYSAFTAGRYPGAHGELTGSGLTTPTF